jgi:hypothetical protein
MVLMCAQLLTMRRHGFVSMRTTDDTTTGNFTTKQLVLPHCLNGDMLQLTLNVECGLDGFVVAQLKAANMAPLTGVPFIGNAVDATVAWQAANGSVAHAIPTVPAHMQGAIATMSLVMRAADVYAFVFQCAPKEAY